jgi:hypothetical protein
MDIEFSGSDSRKKIGVASKIILYTTRGSNFPVKFI